MNKNEQCSLFSKSHLADVQYGKVATGELNSHAVPFLGSPLIAMCKMVPCAAHSVNASSVSDLSLIILP